MTYKCEDCGHVFEEPRRGREPMGDGMYRDFAACPKCGGEPSEAYECAGCGKYFYDCELEDGFCDKCAEEIRFDAFERMEKALRDMGPEARKYLRKTLREHVDELEEALSYEPAS